MSHEILSHCLAEVSCGHDRIGDDNRLAARNLVRGRAQSGIIVTVT